MFIFAQNGESRFTYNAMLRKHAHNLNRKLIQNQLNVVKCKQCQSAFHTKKVCAIKYNNRGALFE